MSLSDDHLVVLLIRYIQAEKEADNEFRKDGSWHTDICNCQRCRDIQAWIELSFWQKLKAKLYL